MSSFIGGSDRRKVRPSRKKQGEGVGQLGNRKPEAGQTENNPMPNGSFNSVLPMTSYRNGKAVFG